MELEENIDSEMQKQEEKNIRQNNQVTYNVSEYRSEDPKKERKMNQVISAT